MTHDIIVVGAGLFGSVVSERLASHGLKVLIVEKRNHIGGNCWSEIEEETGIEIHKYGSHIFHTSKDHVWEYINRFGSFNDYQHTVWTSFDGSTYSMPINLGTINSYYNINLKPFEVKDFLDNEIKKENIKNPNNLEEKAISLIGRGLYEAFIRGYTIKQWEKDPRDLPEEIIMRLPIRNSYNNRYFNDKYEGIPLEGYGEMFRKILDNKNIDLKINTDWFEFSKNLNLEKTPIIYTGGVDQFFNYKYGRLEWRTIDLVKEVHNIQDFQGCSVMNYADEKTPYTRIHEFKHFHPERTSFHENKTVIYKEYSKIVGDIDEPYYPVNTPNNARLLKKYQNEVNHLDNIWIGGRLGSYKYFDMDDTINSALDLSETLKAKLLNK